mmetsp:Transcript_55178/g.135348  ORF Transcript_55178/g.135348 Transcript_55178/m.135348 type:complete len:255 (-) Transcript_55178:35-799(-)
MVPMTLAVSEPSPAKHASVLPGFAWLLSPSPTTASNTSLGGWPGDADCTVMQSASEPPTTKMSASPENALTSMLLAPPPTESSIAANGPAAVVSTARTTSSPAPGVSVPSSVHVSSSTESLPSPSSSAVAVALSVDERASSTSAWSDSVRSNTSALSSMTRAAVPDSNANDDWKRSVLSSTTTQPPLMAPISRTSLPSRTMRHAGESDGELHVAASAAPRNTAHCSAANVCSSNRNSVPVVLESLESKMRHAAS